MKNNYYVLLLAGGSGTKLWPFSRNAKPKQFLDVLGVGKTLIQITYERFLAFIPKENIYVVTHEDFVGHTQEQLGIDASQILAEPSQKNTGVSVAYAAFKINALNPDACLIISPTDQMILDTQIFETEIMRGVTFSEQIKALVSVGASPTFPNINYGYIQRSDNEAVPGIYMVKTFTEKPDLEVAKAFLESGDFLWNSGIFIWKTQNIIKSLKEYESEIFDAFDADKQHLNTPDEHKAVKKIYPFCTELAFDTFVMEKLKNVYVIPSTFGWSDIGTWNNVYENMDKDFFGNVVVGDRTMIVDATNCIINTRSKKLVIVQGVDDLIIVDTPDVLTIYKKEKEKEVKAYIAEVKRTFNEDYS